MPLISNPNAVHLPAGEFRARFGFDKPGLSASSSSSSSSSSLSSSSSSSSEAEKREVAGREEEKDKVKEVVFYCLAGVRSKKAAEMAAGEEGWAGVRIGDWGGGWSEWVERKGEVER